MADWKCTSRCAKFSGAARSQLQSLEFKGPMGVQLLAMPRRQQEVLSNIEQAVGSMLN